jgi:hypothetical protein
LALAAGDEVVAGAELELAVGAGLEVVLEGVGEAEGVGAGVEGAGVVLVSGSTYCWSPAEVPVPPWASATPGAVPMTVASARQPITSAMSRLTSEPLKQ